VGVGEKLLGGGGWNAAEDSLVVVKNPRVEFLRFGVVSVSAVVPLVVPVVAVVVAVPTARMLVWGEHDAVVTLDITRL